MSGRSVFNASKDRKYRRTGRSISPVKRHQTSDSSDFRCPNLCTILLDFPYIDHDLNVPLNAFLQQLLGRGLSHAASPSNVLKIGLCSDVNDITRRQFKRIPRVIELMKLNHSRFLEHPSAPNPIWDEDFELH